MIQWNKYLGCELKDLEELWKELEVTPDKADVSKTYSDGTLYHCFYELGIALSFVGSQQTFDSIDFYKATKPYSPVDAKLLPDGVPHSATAKDLVEMYGEPIEKGGGGRMDIWLRWSQFQVEIPSGNWDDAKDVQWSSLTYFKS